MMLNIVIVLVMFIPFYAALIHKHSGWLTALMTFLWCSACSAVMILCVAVALVLQLSGQEPTLALIGSIVGWGVLDMFIGLKIVLSDKPKEEI